MKITKAVIPAAGFGMRMLPLTKAVVKEMLPIVDRPVIQYAVEEAVSSGIEDIIIVTGRNKTIIEDYFDYCPELESKLNNAGMKDEAARLRSIADSANIYFVRQKEAKGLGDAVSCVRNFIGDEAFAVILPDDIIMSEVPVTKQLMAVFAERNASVVGIKPVPPNQIHRYSSLKLESRGGSIFRVLDIIEKPSEGKALSNYAIMGRYILTPTIFDVLDSLEAGYHNEIQLTDGINLLLKKEMILALDFNGCRYDTGSIRGYWETAIDFALKDSEMFVWLKDFILAKAEDIKEKLNKVD